MNNEYRLVIEFGEGISEGQTPQEKAKKQQEQTQKALSSFFKTQAIKPFISYAKNTYINNLQTQTGSRQLAERTNFAFSLIDGGINAFQSAVGGVAFAGSLGLSAGVGAGLGLAMFGLNIAFDLMEKQNQIDNSRKIENLEIQRFMSRNGASFNKSRMGA